MTTIVMLEGTPAMPAEYGGKFLQLRLRGEEEVLLFAPATMHRFHNQILAHFLKDHGIAHRWVSDEQLEVCDATLKVIGGGRFHLNTVRKTLVLSDNSHAYGRFDERGLKERIGAARHAWSGFDVIIGR